MDPLTIIFFAGLGWLALSSKKANPGTPAKETIVRKFGDPGSPMLYVTVGRNGYSWKIPKVENMTATIANGPFETERAAVQDGLVQLEALLTGNAETPGESPAMGSGATVNERFLRF